MPSSRGGGLQLKVLGFPVTISLSIVLLLAFLGLNLGDPVAIVLWVAIGVLSILLHELGHAVTARAAGASPEIRLAGLGGVTTYRQSSRTRERGWGLAISLAGPAVGIVLGTVAILLGAPWRGVPRGGTVVDFAGYVFVFTSMGWGALNLLPIMPLDGGQALAELLPGDPATRRRRATVVGVVVGVAVVGAALVVGQTFAAIIVGLMTWQNVGELRRDRGTAELRQLVVDGRFGEARARLDRGEGQPEDLAVLQRHAHEAGHFQTAAEVGETALARGYEHWTFAFNAACSWARLGADDRAFALLDRAVELGAEDEALRRDGDLDRLRDDPRFGRLLGEDPPPPPPPASWPEG